MVVTFQVAISNSLKRAASSNCQTWRSGWIGMVGSMRTNWDPIPVSVEVRKLDYLDRFAPSGRGRLVLVEHLRDVPNAIVYGPGAMHFLPRIAYVSAFGPAHLTVREERSMTPFLRLFVLERNA